MLEGAYASHVPSFLQNLFPKEKFMIPLEKPGVYVCYFPHNSKIYIGESKNIIKEISRLKYSKEKRPRIIEAFAKSGENVQVYALRQGEGCAQKETRLQIELDFIRIAGQNSLNVAGNPTANLSTIVHHPLITAPHFEHYTHPWTLHDLHYPNLQPRTSESYIYILVNKKSKRFYIGETGNARFFQRMREHRQHTAHRAIVKVQEEKYFNPTVYDEMAEDLLYSSNEFLYSIIEYTDKLPRSQILARESELITEAYKKYNSRLYNKPSPKILKVLAGTHRLDCSGRAPKIRPTTLTNLKYPCIVDNIWYDTVAAAIRGTGVGPGPGEKHIMFTRLKSTSFPNYIYIKEPRNKKIPSIPQIQEKLKLFNQKLQSLINNEPTPT